MVAKIKPFSNRVVIGVWITALYVLCICLVVYSLSSYQFQVKLNSIPFVNVGVASVYEEHECNLQGLKLDGSMLVRKVPCIPNSSAIGAKYYTTGQVLTVYKEIIELANNKLSTLKTLRGELDEAITRLSKNDKNNAGNQDYFSNIDNLKGNKYTIDLEIQNLLLKQNKDMEDNELLVETFADIKYFETFFRIFTNMFGIESFWAIPKSILEIILILSMGILGSLMFITIEFLKEENKNEKFSMYFFRPSLGMIVALSMYVMVKSGQSAFGDDNVEYFSPFLISFFGIVSGMLAEKAYHKLALTGETVLNVNEEAKQAV